MLDIFFAFFLFGPGAYAACVAIGIACHRPTLATLRFCWHHLSRACVAMLEAYLESYERSLSCHDGFCIDMFGRVFPDGTFPEPTVVHPEAPVAEPSGDDAPVWWDSPAIYDALQNGGEIPG